MTEWSNSAAQTLLEARTGHALRVAVWIEARNRSDNSTETFGMWSGDNDLAATVDGDSRNYYAFQDNLIPPVISYRKGTQIQTAELMVYGVARDEMRTLLETYDAKFAPIEIHSMLFPPDYSARYTKRVFKGFINEITLTRPGQGGESTARMSLVSTARKGTTSMDAKKSDEAQRRRLLPSGDPDLFRRYGSLGNVSADRIGAQN